MKIQIENVIWQFAKFYRKKYIAEHPDKPISMSIAAVALCRALKDAGYAVEELDAGGNATWKVTQQFLCATGLKPGPFITLGPEVH